MKRKSLTLLALIVTATISLGAYYSRRPDAAPSLTTEAATRGAIATRISATGTLQAVTTVQVGSQVSGTVESLRADFNSLVRKGEILATLDQSSYATALEQARASLGTAEADAERLRVAAASAESALARARELSAKQLLPKAELESAESGSRSAASQVIGGDAKIQQARAAVLMAEVNLAKTVIRAPIDGVVIARNVDVGQTVSASMSAPTLYVLAADLAAMQLNTNIDESDLGNVAPDQPVTFRVDAYPSQTFSGRVSQVRLSPTTVQNVVTYAAIIDAPNPELKLKPGMTATVTIEVARRDGVLRVPAAALRFKPDAELLARFGAAKPAGGKQATVWISNGATLSPVAVTTGLSDGSFTEILGTPFAEGALVVTRAASTAATAAKASPTNGNPLMPATRGPGGPPGR